MTPRFEVPLGVVDGINRNFQVSHPIEPGTLAYYLRGRLMIASDPTEGVTILDATLGLVQINLAPELGSAIQFFYFDPTPTVAATNIVSLTATVALANRLTASIAVINQLGAKIWLARSISSSIGATHSP